MKIPARWPSTSSAWLRVVLYVGLYSDSIGLPCRKAHFRSISTLRYKHLCGLTVVCQPSRMAICLSHIPLLYGFSGNSPVCRLLRSDESGTVQLPPKTHRCLVEFRELSRVRSTESSGFMERAMGIEIIAYRC